MDLLALIFLVASLFVVFRGSEKWMHQHVFKVGWLLTHNIKTTVVFYYTAFLPGVLLHEISYWLAAGILNVRARQSVQFPQLDDIKELQLGLVKLDARAHPVKRVLIELCPLLVALGALTCKMIFES